MEHREAGEEPWGPLWHGYHVLFRGALCAKRWLGGRRVVDQAVRETFAREAPGLCFGEDALAWQDELDALACPPGGRLTGLVLGRLARAHGVDEQRVGEVLFAFSKRYRNKPPGR